MLFSVQSHKSPTIFGLRMFQTMYNILFVSIVYSPVLSISKLTYFK